MSLFEIGPDMTGENGEGDLRTARSYFVVPLLGRDPEHGSAHYQQRILRFLRKQQESGLAVTDIYVLSHGWHRNFFSAVAAYDRLLSRFAVLFQRGRLAPKPEPYRPLFLAMHWNSDPDEDGWVDTAGRRDKTSFLENAWALFEPATGVSEGALKNSFEDIYEFMTFISAPGIAALNNPMDDKAASLLQQLALQGNVRGSISGSPMAKPEDKASLIWRCYDEATSQRVLLDQSEEPQPYANPWSAVANLLKFLVATLGLVTLLGLLPRLLAHLGIWPLAREWGSRVFLWPLHLSGTGRILGACPPTFQTLILIVIFMGLLTATALIILRITIFWQERLRPRQGARGLPVFAVGSWLPLQVLLTAPLLVYLFATFLFRTWFILLAPLAYALGLALHGGRFWPTALFVVTCASYSFLAARLDLPLRSVFDERSSSGSGPATWRIRDHLAALARKPIGWLRRAVASDSQAVQMGNALDKQLAFWEMQRNGALAGGEAGAFLADLLPTLAENNGPEPSSIRLHFVGHSFGGLVLTNAAHVLAQIPIPMDSLVLLEAAVASAWFESEPWCRDKNVLRGVLACIYSAYDMANGFYYPAANNSRMAAGYVGLCNVGSRDGKAQKLGKNGLFASLMQPPDLQSHLVASSPYVLNLDASRLIYAGNPAAGGGHDDIYKDDVIHMIWAVTALAHR